MENCPQPSSGCVTVLETITSIRGCAPKVTNENLCISSDHQCCSESLHKNEHGTQKTLCFFILPVSGGFKHLFERLQLVQCNGCSFLSIYSDGKYCKSSQKLLMMQYQVSNPSCMLFLVGNFSSMEFLEHENHPLELLMHKAWLLQAFHHPHLLPSLSH